MSEWEEEERQKGNRDTLILQRRTPGRPEQQESRTELPWTPEEELNGTPVQKGRTFISILKQPCSKQRQNSQEGILPEIYKANSKITRRLACPGGSQL